MPCLFVRHSCGNCADKSILKANHYNYIRYSKHRYSKILFGKLKFYSRPLIKRCQSQRKKKYSENQRFLYHRVPVYECCMIVACSMKSTFETREVGKHLRIYSCFIARRSICQLWTKGRLTRLVFLDGLDSFLKTRKHLMIEGLEIPPDLIGNYGL